jgi:hypothetical protein
MPAFASGAGVARRNLESSEVRPIWQIVVSSVAPLTARLGESAISKLARLTASSLPLPFVKLRNRETDLLAQVLCDLSIVDYLLAIDEQ